MRRDESDDRHGEDEKCAQSAASGQKRHAHSIQSEIIPEDEILVVPLGERLFSWGSPPTGGRRWTGILRHILMKPRSVASDVAEAYDRSAEQYRRDDET